MRRLVEVISPAPREEWRAVIAGDAGALPEHAPEWVDALCADGRYSDASRLYVFADEPAPGSAGGAHDRSPDGSGEGHFVLPLVRRRGPRGAGGWLQSYPSSWGMGGLVGAGADPEVLGTVLDDLRGLRQQRVGIRPEPSRWREWSQVSQVNPQQGGTLTIPRRAHVIDLTGGIDAVWQGLNKSARRGTRLAERAGVRIETDRTGALLEEYYGLYLLSVDRWAERQHEPRPLAQARARRRDPLRKLQAMAEHLGKNFLVTMAYVDDRPAFGSLTLLGRTAHDTRAAMDRDRIGSTCAGDLVQWTTLQLACELGCSAYHLGESGQSASLAQYKEKFGAVPYDYAELRLERLPYTRTDAAVRSLAKRVLRFRDA